ncbi:hypothetical protein PCASD_20117 [Puccinia coronata f. sp. avenae]|uniref:Uncharacterized protein n=1 Tax=Puccinia coronata f. sp. avenae TaxID=200324 RepID=A0A2N5T0J0_9BASI|nr:hypothetical protein PCASD_20117 [Puccinia coronata f. sp. avenae]
MILAAKLASTRSNPSQPSLALLWTAPDVATLNGEELDSAIQTFVSGSEDALNHIFDQLGTGKADVTAQPSDTDTTFNNHCIPGAWQQLPPPTQHIYPSIPA